MEETMKKWLLVLVAVAALAWTGWWMKQRFFVDDETRVKRLVSAMATMVEKAEINSLGNTITEDYTSEQATDKTTLLNAIRIVRLQHAQMFIYLSDQVISVAPDGQTAEVTLVAKVMAKPRGGGAATEFHAERIRIFFRKTDDGWKMYRTESPKLNFD
jgi:ketosteroid isomerase-like protein